MKKNQRELRPKTVQDAREDAITRVPRVLAQLKDLNPTHAASVLRAALILLEGERLDDGSRS